MKPLRTDLKGAVFQAARDGKKLAGVVFTNAKDPKAVEFCDCVKENGLPVFATSLPLFAAAGKINLRSCLFDIALRYFQIHLHIINHQNFCFWCQQYTLIHLC